MEYCLYYIGIFLSIFIIGWCLFSISIHLKEYFKKILSQLRCDHSMVQCREIGFQTFCTCTKCGKLLK